MLKNFNYRHLQQKKEMENIKNNQELVEFINSNNKFSNKHTKYYQELIFTTFFDYNEATCRLICKIVASIYQNYKLYGVPCTFRSTAKTFTDHNKSRTKTRSSITTAHRLKILEEEGVIKRLPTDYKSGSYYVLCVNIEEEFKRDKFKDFKTKDTATTPPVSDLIKIEAEDKELIKKEDEFKEQNNMLIDDLEKELEKYKKELDEDPELDEEDKQELLELKESAIYANTPCNIIKQTQFEKKFGEEIDKIEEKEENIEEKEKEYIDEDEIAFNNALEQLSKLKLKEGQTNEELLSMFTEFCQERTKNGKKIDKKRARGINMALNNLLEMYKKGYDVFDCLNTALAYNWQGFKEEYFKSEKQKLVQYRGWHSRGSVLSDLIDQQSLQLVLNQNQNNNIVKEATTSQVSQAQQLARATKKLNERIGEEQADKILIEREAQNKEKYLKIINSCKSFDKTKNNYQNLFINILDNGDGEKCYFRVIDYFKDKINNKYPQDIRRQSDFLATANSILKIAKEMNVFYIPLYYVYFIMINQEEDWVDNTNDVDLLNDLYDINKLTRFMIDNLLVVKTDEEYIGGCFRKVIKERKFNGVHNGTEPTKIELLFDFFVNKLLKNNLSKEELINIIATRLLTKIKQEENNIDLNQEDNIIDNKTTTKFIDFLQHNYKNINIYLNDKLIEENKKIDNN